MITLKNISDAIKSKGKYWVAFIGDSMTSIAKLVLKEVFSIGFNPEKYIADTLAGEKYPQY